MNNLKIEYNRYFDRNFKNSNQEFIKDDKISQIEKIVGQGKRVLDVGCMTGYLSYFLQIKDNIVSGVDFLESAVESARNRGIDAFHCDIEHEQLPFADSTFDTVVFSEVIEHLVDPIVALREIRRVLKPGGVIIVATPNIAYLQYRLELLAGRLPDFCEFRDKYPERPYNFQHKSLFTHKVLEAALSDAGFIARRWTAHSAYKNRFERFFDFLERPFPGIFRKNIIVLAEKHGQ